MKKATIWATTLALVLSAAHAEATNWRKIIENVSQGAESRSSTVQHDGAIEYAFSPNKGAENLVLKVIGTARSEIRMMSYSLTSSAVVEALISARHRGVDVAVVADHKSNVSNDQSGKSRAALSSLANAGCRVRTISAYQIHHDKVIVVDRETVETGSFNFSSAAASKNSENVMVVWKNSGLARGYLEHWQDRFNKGEDYQNNY